MLLCNKAGEFARLLQERQRIPMNSLHFAGLDETLSVPLALGARVANIFYTSQVQLAYACAERLRESAERSMQTIDDTWPSSPVREWTLEMVRAQAQSAERLAQELLAGARRNCGLAFAPVGGRGAQ
jgi:hypothetical protein